MALWRTKWISCILDIQIFMFSISNPLKIKGTIFFINFFTLPTHLLKDPIRFFEELSGLVGNNIQYPTPVK